jgi:hypothetical protein
MYSRHTVMKDRKLAIPLGLKVCRATSCTTAPESEWAGRGKQHLRANLLGMRVLLEGTPRAGSTALGFDDYLQASGAAPLATEVRADLAAALAAVDALPDAPLAATLTAQPDKLVAVHAAVKELTDFLKMELTITLQIKPPVRVEGDHD